MHQSFVKAAGPGNIGDCNFSLCKAGVCPVLWRDFYGQSPAQILAGKCEMTRIILGMEGKVPAVPWHCRDNAEVKTWHLSPTVSLISPAQWGCGLTIDWYIT